jgi:hypothetical protein
MRNNAIHLQSFTCFNPYYSSLVVDIALLLYDHFRETIMVKLVNLNQTHLYNTAIHACMFILYCDAWWHGLPANKQTNAFQKIQFKYLYINVCKLDQTGPIYNFIPREMPFTSNFTCEIIISHAKIDFQI